MRCWSPGVDELMDDIEYSGSQRTILPKDTFNRPQVYLGGAMEDVEVSCDLELDGFSTPGYVKLTAWLLLVLMGCLIPAAAG